MPGRYSTSLTLNIHGSMQQKSNTRMAQSIIEVDIHGSVQQKSNARKAQSIVDVQYTWLGATVIKFQEGSLSLTLFTHGPFAV